MSQKLSPQSTAEQGGFLSLQKLNKCLNSCCCLHCTETLKARLGRGACSAGLLVSCLFYGNSVAFDHGVGRSQWNRWGTVGPGDFCLQKRCIPSKSSDENKPKFPNKNLLDRTRVVSDTVPCFGASYEGCMDVRQCWKHLESQHCRVAILVEIYCTAPTFIALQSLCITQKTRTVSN